MNSEVATNNSSVQLWNPMPVVLWSCVFTPIFGSLLIAKNWTALGMPDKSKTAMMWFYSSLAVSLMLGTFAVLNPESDLIVSNGFLVFICLWAGYSAAKQRSYLKDNFKEGYAKRGWGKPLGIASAIFITIVSLSVVSNLVLAKYSAEDISEINGVWRGDSNGILITFKFAKKKSIVQIGDKKFAVNIKNWDDEKQVLTLEVNKHPEIVWNVHKIIEANGSFSLVFALDNGTSDTLSFVRNLPE